MPRLLSNLLIFLILFGSSTAFALSDEKSGLDLDIQPTDVIIWSAVQATVEDNGRIAVGLRLQTKDQFTIYKDRLKIQGPPGFAVVSGEYPEAFWQDDPMSDEQVEVYRGGDFLVFFDGLEEFEGESFPVAVTFLGCTVSICLFPYTVDLEVPLYRSTSGMALGSTVDSGAENISSESEVIDAVEATAAPTSWDDKLTAFFQDSEYSLTILLLVALLGGLLTNLTPCVFPMIPITLRILGAKNQSHPRLNSVLYATGIVLTYTTIGTVAALSGGLFGAFLGNFYVTLFFGILFILLGLSMLGYGNFSSLQALGNRLGSSQSSTLNIFLMGTGAGFVAAPCTGPILGALLIFTPKLGSVTLSILLFFSYSLGFALPYLFLGMAAQRVSNIKVPATLQIGIKVFFAAVMFGLALFYLKTPIHKSLLILQGYWASTALTLIIVGLSLTLFVIRHQKLAFSKFALVLPTTLLGIGLFAGSQWVSGADIPSQIQWYHSEAEAYEAAQRLQRPVLVDGWAEWCAACKQMDVTTFQDPRIVAELNESWIVLKLDMTEFNAENESLAAKYGMPGLPTLVLLPQDGDLNESSKLTGYVSSDKLLVELRQFIRN